MKKTSSWPLWVAGIGIGALVYFVGVSRNESSLDKSYPVRAPGEVRPAPVYTIPQNDVAVDMIPREASIEKSSGMFVRIDAKHVRSLVPYTPVWYEVEGLPNLRVSIPVDKNQSLAAVEFTHPLSLEGKVLQIFGMDPHTKQRATLFERKFVDRRKFY